MRLFRVGERVLLAHRYSWAKKAAAFPRNSVFIRNSRFSRSSSRSRARSGRVNGGSSPACSTRCLLTQLPSVPSCTPISRATSAIGREVSTTRRTASDLNSGVNFRRFSRIDVPPFRTGPYWVRYPKCGRHATLAEWHDNYFGPHRYGVKFPDGPVVYPAEQVNQAQLKTWWTADVMEALDAVGLTTAETLDFLEK